MEQLPPFYFRLISSNLRLSYDRGREPLSLDHEREVLRQNKHVQTGRNREDEGCVSSRNSDEAKNRRVEIWLVPRGLPLPSAARDAKDLPEAEMTRIGCPK
jgi:hypothetical protein